MYEKIDPDAGFRQELVDVIYALLSEDVEKRPSASDICRMGWLSSFCLADYDDFATDARREFTKM